MFYKTDKNKKEVIVIAVYVDYCIISASNVWLIEEFKDGLHKHIEVMDLGKLHWMLGLEIQHDCEACTIHISQHAYINSIIQFFNLSDMKPLSTPIDISFCLTSKQASASTSEHTIMCYVAYCEAVEALN